ncbi:MAG TPA: acyl-CoA dehydrogenase family protein [Dehalococcoidia bacterium]|nr:acyl-CoA dehydrogenase family protein [Dehalococcoidia bacterium]
MDLHFSQEDEEFRQEVLQFIRQELPADWRGTGLLSEAKGDEEWQFALKMLRKVGAKGWHSLAWPREYGGQASMTRQFIFSEEMYYHELPGVDLVGTLMLAPSIIQHGSEQQKREHLPKISRGEVVWCQGFSEPGAGSDLASLSTRAADAGNHFIVNGQKVWSTNANRADWGYFLVRTDPDVPKHKGISFLLVDMRTPGLTARHLPNIVGTYCEVFLDNVCVPKENLVGKVNDGWRVANTVLGYERSGVHRISAARRNLDKLIEYAQQTVRDGEPLFKMPLVRNRLTDLFIEAQAVRLLAYRVLSLQNSGRDVSYEVSMSRLGGSLLQQHVAGAAMDILGPLGLLDPGSKWAPLSDFRREYLYSLGATVGAGTAEIQRNIIATRGLGLPKS